MIKNTFYGPWLVKVDHVDIWPDQSFVVAGSDNADGRHLVPFDKPFEILVQGERWTIEIEQLSSTLGWVPGEARPPVPEGGARRTTAFVPVVGLTVKLGTGSAAWEVLFGDIWFTGLLLLCVSKDPAVNPIPTPNPFDFTLPER